MFASPTMTCSRRYFSGSACGPARGVLMGGGGLGRGPPPGPPACGPVRDRRSAVLGAVLGTDLPRAGEDLAAHEERHEVLDDAGEGHLAVPPVGVVGAGGAALGGAV